MMSALLMATVLVHGASALLSLALPPQCYVSCLSQALAKVGCAFDDVHRPLLMISAYISYHVGAESRIQRLLVHWSDA